MTEKELPNHEIVTIAVYLLGGASKLIDTEDIAKKANELAPGRFTWRKYKDQINIDTVRKRLWDARKKEKGGFLIGSERNGWQLTEAGLRFARAAEPSLAGRNLGKERLGQQELKWRNAERSRIVSSDAFAKFVDGEAEAVTPDEVEAMFRVDPYVVGKARERKVIRIINTFGDDPQIGPAVRELGRRLQEASDD